MNDVRNILDESFSGFIAAHSDIVIPHPNARAVLRKNPNRGKVALVSGGGSGHEPLHAGFVGEGMLDAAVLGEIFTSPPADQIYETARYVTGDAGVLFLVKNYTGDILNFQMASEMLEADNIPTQTVIISDDIAVKDSLYTAGRRGVAGTVMVEKIAGALAETGASLSETADIARHVCGNLRTIGAALSSCTVPAAGRPTFSLGDDEIELGIGIHGEPGCERIPMKSAAELVRQMAAAVCGDASFCEGDELLAFVNGMGGTPLIELYLVYDEVVKFLNSRKLTAARNLVGNYVTSLDMQGFSLTLMRFDAKTKALWDADSITPAIKFRKGI